MEGNKITAATKEKTDVLEDAYKHTLELLDPYDHQTLTCPGRIMTGMKPVKKLQ